MPKLGASQKPTLRPNESTGQLGLQEPTFFHSGLGIYDPCQPSLGAADDDVYKKVGALAVSCKLTIYLFPQKVPQIINFKVTKAHTTSLRLNKSTEQHGIQEPIFSIQGLEYMTHNLHLEHLMRCL